MRSAGWEGGDFVSHRVLSRVSLFIIALFFALTSFFCSTSKLTSYPYHVLTDDCNCAEYSRRDGKIEYLFRATYRMDSGIATTIEVGLTNNGDDTLWLDVATAKISSRNITYQYNDKFIPLPALSIPPHQSDVVRMVGKETSGADNWHKIAGERLTITLKGLRQGDKTLKQQTVEFVPVNPKLSQD